MSDIRNNTLDNNELWQAFYTEVSEQLDNLELILADNHAESNADIHQLFRDFHTIKSSCAMMDFHSMEKIAHASEDYLDLVRKGRTSLTPAAIHHLLGGIDWLKSQLQNAKNTGNLPENNAELVATLQALSAAHIDNATTHSVENSNTEDTATESFVQTLSEDEINEFASACQQELLIGLSPGAEPAKIKRSLNKLVSICNLVGFTGISSLLKKYIRATNPLSANRAASIAAEIIERIISVEKNYDVDCGSESLRTVFLDAMFVDFAQLSGRLDYLLDLIENNPDDTQSIAQCEDLLLILCVNSSLFGYRDLLNFFRYVLQTIRSIRRGDIPDKRAAFYAVRNAVDFPIAETVHDGETASVKTELQTRLSDLNYSISKAIYASGNEGFIDSILGLVDIQRETLEILMPESLSYLHSATTERKILYEIDIDIDCDPLLMDNLVNWISNSGHIVHNRSVFDDHSREDHRFHNCICFIVAFDKTPAIESDLQHLDGTMQSLRYRTIHYHDALQKPALEKPAEPAGNKHPATTLHAADHQASATLRIESHTLDNLVTQTGEMIMAHNMLQHEITSKTFEEAISFCKTLLEDDASPGDNAFVSHDWLEALNTAANTIFTAQQNIIDKSQKVQQSVSNIQKRILDLRVIPISSVFNRIPQLVKKMAESQGKKIQLVIEGKDVRIDKGMVDILMEPLIHLVRNCIDHGIEKPDDRVATGKPEEATLVLAASQEGSTLILEISDNGRGINLEKIQESAIRKGFIEASDKLSDQEICKLIFLPGFSTADVITETSGRGVGMDVVITRINHIGGDIDVQTTPGHGTRFTMTLPLSAAIQSVVMVTASHHRYAIPHSSVMEIISLPPAAVCSVLGQPAFILRNVAIPLFHLHDLALQNREAGTGALGTHNDAVVLVMAQGTQRIGVVVDEVHGREDVFVRELHKNLRSLPSICGATALGNGELAFILNSSFLLQSATQKTSAWLNQSSIAH